MAQAMELAPLPLSCALMGLWMRAASLRCSVSPSRDSGAEALGGAVHSTPDQPPPHPPPPAPQEWQEVGGAAMQGSGQAVGLASCPKRPDWGPQHRLLGRSMEQASEAARYSF